MNSALQAAGRRSLHGDGAGQDAGDDDGAHQQQRKMSATETVARARIVSDGSKIPRIDPKNAGSGYVVDVQRTGPPPSPSPAAAQGGREKEVERSVVRQPRAHYRRSWA